MKNTKLLLFALVVLAFVVVSCEGKEPTSPGDKNTLFNTRWKLVGFFDVGNGKIENVVLRDCEDCYTLDFWKDTTITEMGKEYWMCTGRLITIRFSGSYIADYAHSTIYFHQIVRAHIEEPYDGDKYGNALEVIQEFELNESELKLYYNNKKSYLLFRGRQ